MKRTMLLAAALGIAQDAQRSVGPGDGVGDLFVEDVVRGITGAGGAANLERFCAIGS